MRRLLVAASILLIAPTAWAQSNSELMDRISRLERDVNFVQKQVYTGAAASDPNGMPVPTGAGSAALEVRISAMEEQLRVMRGQVETAQFASGEAQRNVIKLKEDMEYRLGALEQAQSAAAVSAQTGAASAVVDPAVDPVAEPVAEPVASVKPDVPASYQPAPAASTGADFPDSNAAYNAAFKELNGKNYSAAASKFDAFVRKYPKDPLTSNAYYWLGESYYARGDYTRAAEGFRKGFESNPQGQKAPDNLLKLAMSLDNIKRTSEACIVLGQVVSKYGTSAPRTKERAEAERSRMQCK